ncbi:hypothetical protein HER39_10540, partial [Arthrobacter deserti]|nr:hypothetical protein [Arthrobacter deserti]
LGLRILRTVRGGGQDTLGTVEFRARYRRHGAEHEHHEGSAFVREDGRWVYREPLSLG